MNSSNYKILFPVDFSNRSVSAARHVKVWRAHFGAALETVHIVDNQRHGQPHYDDSIYSEQSRVVTRRTADLEHFCLRQFGEHAAHAVVLAGSKAGELERFVNRERIDLIMLPRKHQGFISKLFGDSLAAILLERCTASIWMTEHLEENHAVAVNNILCAIHFGQAPTLDAQNYRIVETTRQLVLKFGAEVTFLQATGNSKSCESSSSTETGAGSQSWMEQAQDLLGGPIKLLRRPGKVISGIRDTADQVGADLVVVGRVRPEAITLGRQSRILKIDHAVRCPVLSVW